MINSDEYNELESQASSPALKIYLFLQTLELISFYFCGLFSAASYDTFYLQIFFCRALAGKTFP